MKKIKNIYLLKTFKSYYCQMVFLAGLVGGYFLIPKDVLHGYLKILAYLFIALFALTITCIVRNTKERIALAKTYKGSVLSIIVIATGLAALQVCGMGAPVCGATVGLGIVSAILPSIAFTFLTKYGLEIFIIVIVLQLLSLYFMNCFKQFSPTLLGKKEISNY